MSLFGKSLALAGAMFLCVQPSVAQTAAGSCSDIIDLLGDARRYSLEADIARAERSQLEAQRDALGGSAWPQLSTYVQMRGGDYGLSSSSVRNQVGLKATQRIYDFSKSRIQQKSYGHSIDQKAAEAEQRQQESVEEAMDLYLGILLDQKRADLAGQEMDGLEALARQLEELSVDRKVTLDELAQVRAQLASVRISQIQSQSSVSGAMVRLNALTGQAKIEACPLTSVRAQLGMANAAEAVGGADIDYMVSMQPEVRAADSAIKSIELERELEKRSRLPDVQIVGLYTYSQNDFGEAWQERDSVGLEFSVPLLSGGVLKDNRRAVEAKLSSARLQRSVLLRDLATQLRGTLQKMDAMALEVEARREALSIRQNYLREMQAAYDAGFRTMRDLIEVRSEIFDQENMLAEAEVNELFLRMRLLLLSGQLSNTTGE